MSSNETHVPVVAYHSGGTGPAAKEFTDSLRRTGFGVLSGHKISTDLIFEVYGLWKDFFADSAKAEYLFDKEKQDGYFPFRSENAKGYSQKDLKEFYHFYLWGRHPKKVAEKSKLLFSQLQTMAEELLLWIDEHTPIDIRNQFSMPLNEMIQDSGNTLLRVIHYPPLKGDEEVGAVRAAAHEDINLITLLPTATAPGLQALDALGHWHDIPCEPGNIVVNVGDMLQLATDGYYRSTTHRVINPRDAFSSEPRFSMPLFLHPRSEVLLSRQMTAGQYLQQRLKEIGLK